MHVVLSDKMINFFLICHMKNWGHLIIRPKIKDVLEDIFVIIEDCEGRSPGMQLKVQ